MSADAKTFDIQIRRLGDHHFLTLSGVIDENADLSPLGLIGTAAEINMKEIRRINSFGVRSWIDSIRQVPKAVALRFVECPPPVIDQCNMVTGFLGHGELVSFYAPLLCEECDESRSQLFVTQVCRENDGKLPNTPCPRCGRSMEVDDLEDQYLLFIREPS